MKVLLDTHAFLWWVTDDPRLSSRARELIQEGGSPVFFSAASAWEMAIKARIGKLSLPQPAQAFVREQLHRNGFTSLAVEVGHALQVGELPAHHRDPFDRLLVAQSQMEKLPLLSSDPLISQYEVDVIW
ncbi:MAG: type II toxin-antitoxin system VapC family toxin [Vicinamibacteria bacterium]